MVDSASNSHAGYLGGEPARDRCQPRRPVHRAGANYGGQLDRTGHARRRSAGYPGPSRAISAAATPFRPKGSGQQPGWPSDDAAAAVLGGGQLTDMATTLTIAWAAARCACRWSREAGMPAAMLWEHTSRHSGSAQGQGSSLGWACTAAAGRADTTAAAWAAGVPVTAPTARATPAAAARTYLFAWLGEPAPGTANAPSRRSPPPAMMCADPGPIVVAPSLAEGSPSPVIASASPALADQQACARARCRCSPHPGETAQTELKRH